MQPQTAPAPPAVTCVGDMSRLMLFFHGGLTCVV